jgi:hypothetical protein
MALAQQQQQQQHANVVPVATTPTPSPTTTTTTTTLGGSLSSNSGTHLRPSQTSTPSSVTVVNAPTPITTATPSTAGVGTSSASSSSSSSSSSVRSVSPPRTAPPIGRSSPSVTLPSHSSSHNSVGGGSGGSSHYDDYNANTSASYALMALGSMDTRAFLCNDTYVIVTIHPHPRLVMSLFSSHLISPLHVLCCVVCLTSTDLASLLDPSHQFRYASLTSSNELRVGDVDGLWREYQQQVILLRQLVSIGAAPQLQLLLRSNKANTNTNTHN